LDYTEIQREIVREGERETFRLRGVEVHGDDVDPAVVRPRLMAAQGPRLRLGM
jgi:hypothetical protein